MCVFGVFRQGLTYRPAGLELSIDPTGLRSVGTSGKCYHFYLEMFSFDYDL